MSAVLITGVAGFIGSHVARRFATAGFDVVGVDDLSGGDRANVPRDVEFLEIDLSRAPLLARLPGRCEKILHLAGQSSGEISFDDPEADLAKNTVSTLNLIRYAMHSGVERLIYASSMSVYGSVRDEPISETHACTPLSCYGVGKLAAENYLKVYRKSVQSVALRMFNVYGPGQNMRNLRQGMVSIYLAQAVANGRIEVKGSLERFRDFIYIDDVVEAWWRAASLPAALGRTVNVGTGVRTTVGDLLAKVCAAVPGSDYYVSGGTPGDQNGIFADTARLGELLGLRQFVPLDAGLARFAEWARQAT
jgi:UDP-glucose 4-epimerase